MASRRSSGGNRQRKFVWARDAGTLHPTTGDEYGQADLMAAVKGRYGGDILVGSTIMTIRGYIRPNVLTADTAVAGRTAIRVCSQSVIEAPSLEHGPGDGVGTFGNPEADWMGYLPWLLETGGSPAATWNESGGPWGVEIGSSRKMEELGQTLGIFSSYRGLGMAAGTDVTVPLDYDLSIGLKLA